MRFLVPDWRSAVQHSYVFDQHVMVILALARGFFYCTDVFPARSFPKRFAPSVPRQTPTTMIGTPTTIMARASTRIISAASKITPNAIIPKPIKKGKGAHQPLVFTSCSRFALAAMMTHMKTKFITNAAIDQCCNLSQLWNPPSTITANNMD